MWALESHVTDNFTLGQWEAFIHVGRLRTSNKSVAVHPDRTAFALAALMLPCLGTATYMYFVYTVHDTYVVWCVYTTLVL